jgi:DNA-binding transcriptional LysR family regulator
LQIVSAETLSPYDLNLRHLAAASEIGRAGSISAAALVVNMSQSALTQAVARLETQLDQPLFTRQVLGAAMNPAAAPFFARTERALAYLAEAVQSILRGPKPPRAGRVEHRLSMSQLRALIAVTRAENYTLAATATGVSQPTIYRAIRQLELSLGINFFAPSGRMVRATPAAKILARAAQLAAAELQAGIDEISALRNPETGRLTVGSLPLPRAILLPAALVSLAREFPAARLNVREGSYQSLLHDLRHGELDILLGALRGPPIAPEIVQIPLFAAGLYIVANATHPLAGKTRPPAAVLANFPWVIANQGTPMRAKWEQLFAAAGVPLPARVVECGSAVVIRGLLRGDAFLTLLSLDQFEHDETTGVLSRIGAALPGSMRDIGITHRQGWRPTHLQQRFMQILHDLAAARAPEKISLRHDGGAKP